MIPLELPPQWKFTDRLVVDGTGPRFCISRWTFDVGPYDQAEDDVALIDDASGCQRFIDWWKNNGGEFVSIEEQRKVIDEIFAPHPERTER